MDTKLLFVCLGNICRSPAAEGIMQKMVTQAGLSKRIFVDSAGTYSGHEGQSADRRMRKAAENRGYELTGRSRPIKYDDFGRFDMIVVMDDNNYHDVREMAPDTESLAKIRRMAEFSSRADVTHVPDPYYGGVSGFENVLDILEDACRGLLAHINGEK